MFEPEIDRRCLSCGASVRQQAAFCPQCGQMLEKREDPQAVTAEPEETDQTEEVDQVERVDQGDESDQTEAEFIEPTPSPELTSDDGNEDNRPASSEPTHIQAAPSTEPPIVRYREDNDGTVTTTVAESGNVTVHDDPNSYKTRPLTASTLSNAAVADLPDSNFRRPGEVAPVRKEHQVLARVDKIRKVSSVVIDQAAYDPSLRFLLVAGILFVIFVILMILSKVLG
jgi:hypothetical protein